MRIYILTYLYDIELEDCKFTTSKTRAMNWLTMKPKSRQVYGYDVDDDGLTLTWAVRYTAVETKVYEEVYSQNLGTE